MKRKNVCYMCIMAIALCVACDPEEDDKMPEKDETVDDKEKENGSDSLVWTVSITDSKKLLEKMPSGIYRYGDMVIAKSTDGGAFYIPNVTNERASANKGKVCVPANFIATDGRAKEYFFDREKYNYDNASGIFRDTVHYAVITEFANQDALFDPKAALSMANKIRTISIATIVADYPFSLNASVGIWKEYLKKVETATVNGIPVTLWRVEMMGIKMFDWYVDADGICLKKVVYNENVPKTEFELTSMDKNVGTFDETYRKLSDLYCIGTTYGIEQMMPQYTKIAEEWISGKYPASLAEWLPVYSESGTITDMSVIRVFPIKIHDSVCEITVNLTGVNYADAVAYLNVIDKKANWRAEGNVIDNSTEYILYESGLDPCIPKCGHALGDVVYAYNYTLTFMDGLFFIRLEIGKIAHV